MTQLDLLAKYVIEAPPKAVNVVDSIIVKTNMMKK